MSKREKRAIAMMLFADDVCSAGNIVSSSLDVKSSGGKVQLVGKVDSEQAKIGAKLGIDLAYHDRREGRPKADHNFQSLAMKTNKINEINSFLKGEGVYENLKISDHLGLVLTDQDVVFSSCNVYQGYGINLKAKSVNVNNSCLRYDKGAFIASDKALNARNASIRSQGVAAVISRKESVSMARTSISGGKGVLIQAENDVNIDGKETRHTNSSSISNFFSSSEDVTAYSSALKSKVSSSSGSVLIESEKGKIEATATEIVAAENISTLAKKEVVIQDKVTERIEEHKKSNWFETKKTRQRTEEQHCSSLYASGSLRISSRDSSITAIGTDSSVNGDMMLQAAGTVSFKDRVLSQSNETQSKGFSFSAEKGLSFGKKSEQRFDQRLAGRSMKVGDNLTVSGQSFAVKNAMGMDVGNMITDAEDVNFQGTELHNSYSIKEWSVGIEIQSPDTLTVSGTKAFSQQQKNRQSTH